MKKKSDLNMSLRLFLNRNERIETHTYRVVSRHSGLVSGGGPSTPTYQEVKKKSLSEEEREMCAADVGRSGKKGRMETRGGGNAESKVNRKRVKGRKIDTYGKKKRRKRS